MPGVRVFVGNVSADATETDLGEHFNKYNPTKIWVARKPPGFAFIDFDDERDADDAVRKIDGVNGWRVEISRSRRDGGGGGRGRGSGDGRCYKCNEPGHFARECPNGDGGGYRGGGGRDRYDDRRDDRRDDRFDRRRDDDRYRRRSRTPPRRRSPSRSPRRRSRTPPRRRSPSPSPARRYSSPSR